MVYRFGRFSDSAIIAESERRSSPPPTVATQQPAAADAFRNMFAILHNVAMWDLEDAGVIRKGDEVKWSRFNKDLTTFVLKLDDERLDALYALVQRQQPERFRAAV